MITPSFSITQDGSFLTIRIHAPYTNIADCEIEYSEQLFYFSSAPYFLRLHLPCEVIDDDRGTSAYDVDSGYITVTVPKKNEGDHFPNLDMLTELLKAPTVSAKPVVEEISEEGADEVPDEELYAEQKMPEPEIPSEISTFGYGFGWKRHGLFSKFDDEIVKKLISLSTSPESFPISDRVGCCVQITASEFNDEHYLADKMEPPEGLQSVKDFVIVPSKNFEITQEDRDRMKDLPRRVIPPVDNVAVAYSLIDILAGYLYDYRFNEGDESVESGWTISQLSPSLTFLVKWRLAQEAVIGFARRAVTKPLYRSWELLKIVLKDTVATFRAGKSAILHCLLQIQRIMNTSGDFRYLFNDLFITDYCLWIQSLDDAVLKQVTGELEEAVKCLKKADIDCDLEELDLQTQMLKVSLNASGRSLDEEDTSGLRSVLLDSDDEELDSDDEKAMAHLYKQYMRLVARWPKDAKKSPMRNLGAFMEQEVERVFRKEPSLLPRETAICERRLRSLEQLLDNQHLKAYPHTYKSGVFGLTLEHLEETTSDNFREQMGLGKKKAGFFKRLFGKS